MQAFAVAGLLGLGGLFALSKNADVEIDLKNLTIKGKSGDGVLKGWTDFLNARQQRKEEFIKFTDSMAQLQARRNDESGLDKPLPNNTQKKGK